MKENKQWTHLFYAHMTNYLAIRIYLVVSFAQPISYNTPQQTDAWTSPGSSVLRHRAQVMFVDVMSAQSL